MKVFDLFTKCKEILEKENIDSADFEVSVMMEDILGLPRAAEIAVPEKEIDEEKAGPFLETVKRRAEGYPLQYLIGNWEFYGRRFTVGEDVFIPRQDTELLCECAIKYFKFWEAPKLIDLCSGSGCIAVTLAEELKNSDVTAVELYKGAFEYLNKNVSVYGNKVKTMNQDALEPFGEFDGVVSNPPYITGEEMKCLQKEVTFEPKTALFGGEDGLYFYWEITKRWYPHIKENGYLAYEIGDAESRDVADILRENGFSNVKIYKDLSGLDRVVEGIKI